MESVAVPMSSEYPPAEYGASSMSRFPFDRGPVRGSARKLFQRRRFAGTEFATPLEAVTLGGSPVSTAITPTNAVPLRF